MEVLADMLAASRDGDSCIESPPYRNPAGYGVVRFNGDSRLAHRVAYEITYCKPPAGFHVCHKCDNPPCFRPDHLFLGRDLENMRDCAFKERIGGTKLTADQVREIRRLAADGYAQREIAAQFGVSQLNISRIARRHTWKHA